MILIVNGEDWGKLIDPYSVEFYHEKVQGSNYGVSMAGTVIFDTVKVRHGFLANIGLIMSEQYAKLIEFAKADYVTVTYTDPDVGVEVTRQMSITAGNAHQIPLLGGGCAYKNISLEFREI